jgi:CBS domain containing-hemolysin-like protein
MPIDELNELLAADFPQEDFDTVGGLVFYLLGHVPVEGETVDYDGRRLKAERVQGRRIGRVRISALHRVDQG